MGEQAPFRLPGGPLGGRAGVELYAWNGTNFQPVGLDEITRALKQVGYLHSELHEANFYSVVYSVANIGAMTTPDDTISLTFTTPDTTKWGHMEFIFAGVGGSLCRVREGGTGGASPTGAITCKNHQRNSANTSGLLDLSSVAGQLSYDATLDTGGELIIDEYISGASTNQGKAGGSTASKRYEWVLKQNTRYQVSLVDTNTIAATIALHWYEHTNKEA